MGAKYFSDQPPENLVGFAKDYAAHPWKAMRAYQARVVKAYSASMTPLTPAARLQALEQLVPGFTSIDLEGALVWGRAALLAEIGKYVDEVARSR